MFGVTIVTIVGSFADANALRAAPAGSSGQVAGVRQSASDVDALYLWDGTSTANDDGVSVIKPNSISSGNPGRWVIRAIADRNTPPEGVRVIAVPWSNADTVFRTSEGWQVVGVTAAHVYFARPVVGV